jgi:DNA (cytosine-5)-methyltransferase 1
MMKFVDLFCGLGGFHVALKRIGSQCVFACELDSELRELYWKNFGLLPFGDIRNVDEKAVPKHDILCAGFPCQPFSKAGHRNGLNDPDNGNLIFEVLRIMKHHKPKFFIFENVPHLKTHDNDRTWNKVKDVLCVELGYDISEQILSPHEFGIPHIRRRLFIVGCNESLSWFKWPKETNSFVPLSDFLLNGNSKDRFLTDEKLMYLNVWQEFLNIFPKDEPIPKFPIWSCEFGATYPFEDVTPHLLKSKKLRSFKGAYGKELNDISENELLMNIPKYSRAKIEKFPNWKIRYIRQNRQLYLRFARDLKKIAKILQNFPLSFQKFEWNCGDGNRNIFDHIIQFRASGVRIRPNDAIPSLFVSPTQIPIIGWKKRYLSKFEARKLQSLGSISLPKIERNAFKALGNSVNAHLVYLISKNLKRTNGKY